MDIKNAVTSMLSKIYKCEKNPLKSFILYLNYILSIKTQECDEKIISYEIVNKEIYDTNKRNRYKQESIIFFMCSNVTICIYIRLFYVCKQDIDKQSLPEIQFI